MASTVRAFTSLPLIPRYKSSGSCLSSVYDPFECTLDVTFGKPTSGLESHADLIEISLATTAIRPFFLVTPRALEYTPRADRVRLG
jgi:hypothetical protein